MNENFFALLSHAFQQKPEGTALILDDGEDLTYGDLERQSADCAALLASLAVEPGDRVLVQAGKSPESVALYLGCLRAGAVYVPINTAYTPTEVAYFLKDASPRLFVCDPGAEQVFRDLAAQEATAVDIRSLGVDGQGSLTDALAALDPDPRQPIPVVERSGRDLAAILYTSGTTGRSKGAMLTHENLAVSGVVLVDCWGWQEDDVLLHALPIFHVHGLFIAMHCAMLKATPMIFLSGFDASKVIDALPRATVMMGVPTFYTRLLAREDFDAGLCSHMRLFISGSAPLTSQTFEVFEARTGHRILERYGMSETMMNVSNPLVGQRIAGTVGFPLPGVQLRIATEDGRPVPTGEVGVIEVRGPNVFCGYWQMPEKTAEEFRPDGYFITGDQAFMDETGRVTIVGREKDMIISGGYNVYPKEIEVLLDEMPEVVESAVIGVPHADFGEGVVAVVVPAGAEVSVAQTDTALDGRIARFKQPKRVINVPELPRNAMGKVQKNQLRSIHAALFEEGA